MISADSVPPRKTLSAPRLSVHELVAAGREMEPLPPTATQLVTLVATEDWDIDDVVELVSLDQGLTLQVLGVANSVAYFGQEPVATVREAILRLGTGLVVSFTVADGLKGRMSNSGSSDVESALWEHSVAAALVVELMPGACNVRVPPETFAAALLHDLGKLVIHRAVGSHTLTELNRASSVGPVEAHRAELELLETHHGELGGIVARHWGMPESVVDAITYHHLPDEVEHRLSDLVHVSNVLAHRVGARASEGPEEADVSPSVLHRLQLTPDSLDSVSDLAKRSFEDVLARYGS